MELYFSFMPAAERWEFTDRLPWHAHKERCWGYCPNTAEHPGELVSAEWYVWGGNDTYKAAPFMRLTLSADD